MDPNLDPTPPTEAEDREIDAIFENFGGIESINKIYALMDSQLSVIHARAQSLISLGSVTITVTGFSGRIIADTNDYAQALIIIALALVGIGCVITLGFAMPIRWLTSYLDLPPRDWLLVAIRRRTRKSKALRIALYFVITGMVFYLTAIAIMLAYPEATELTRVR